MTTASTEPAAAAPDTTELLAAVNALGPGFRDRMRAHDTASAFPFDNLAEARAAGLHKLCVPVEYGGFGYWRPGNFSGYYRILEALAYWDSNTAQLLQVSNHAAGIIAWHATPAAARPLPADHRRGGVPGLARFRGAPLRERCRASRSRAP